MTRHSETEGLIYYLLDATRLTQRVKIGYTQSLGERINALASETMMRQRPIVLALEEGGTNLETQRHDQFRNLWLMGEWFEYGQPLASHLQTLPSPIGWLLDRPDLWNFARGWQSFSGWTRQRTKVDQLEEPAPLDSDVPDFVDPPCPEPVRF